MKTLKAISMAVKSAKKIYAGELGLPWPFEMHVRHELDRAWRISVMINRSDQYRAFLLKIAGPGNESLVSR